MTEDELMTLWCEGPSHGLPCIMGDGRSALLIRPPFNGSKDRGFGFQVAGEPDMRRVPAEKILHLGGGALAEAPPLR